MAKIARKLLDRQRKWENKITRAKKVRKNWKELFNVDIAREYLDGKQNPGRPEDEWVTINNVYAHLKAQLPALYSADPYFYVRLKKSYKPDPELVGEYEARAKIRQSMLNYLKEELCLKQKVRLSIQDAFFQIGCIKTCYYADMNKNNNYGQPILSENGDPQYVDDELLMEPEYIPANESYKIIRVHPDNILIDEDAGPLEDDWTWVAEEIITTLGDIKKDYRFDKRAVKLLSGRSLTHSEDDDDREERKKGGDVKGRTEQGDAPQPVARGDETPIRYYEIYHIKNKKWCVIAENGEIPLLDWEQLPDGIERHPYSFLRFTLRDDSPLPIPPMSQGIDLCKEYNLARSDILKHRKRFNRKYEVSRQAVGDKVEDAMNKLEVGDDGTCILVNMTGGVQAIKDAPLDQMRYQELAYLKNEMIEVFGGSSDEARGIAGADSATQAGILDKRLEMKEGDSMSMVIDFVKDIARKLDQLVQANITEDVAIRVTGPEGELWSLVRVDDYGSIDGEYEYSVNVGATLPQLPQMERSSWLAFLGLLSNFPHLMLSKRLLKHMAELHHIEDEAMINELMGIAQQMMSGELPMSGATGSQAGVGEDRPVSAIGGQASSPMGG